MCGKFGSYDFNPTKDRDIYAIERKGLGRGRGFRTIRKYSILDPENEAVKKIGDRLLELLELFLENRCLDPDFVYESLPEDYRDEIIDEYVDEIDELRKELAECQELNVELSELLIKGTTETSE